MHIWLQKIKKKKQKTMKHTKFIKHTVGKNILKAYFSTTLYLKADKPDIMSRIEQLLKDNREVTQGISDSILNMKKGAMNKERLTVEENKMTAYLSKVTSYLNETERAQIDKTLDDEAKVINLVMEKLKALDPTDPNWMEKRLNYNQFMNNTHFKTLDTVEAATHDSTERNMKDFNASFLERQVFYSQRKERLKERKEVLEADKELFSERLQEHKTSSLIDDYADPNLEQPSYIDPED